jgi:hypothetical protein
MNQKDKTGTRFLFFVSFLFCHCEPQRFNRGEAIFPKREDCRVVDDSSSQ